MGRQLQHEHSGDQFEEYHQDPGCVWGILHVLDYHHWNNKVRKRVTHHKRHRGRRHAICCGCPRTTSLECHVGEVHSLLDGEADNYLVEQNTAKISPIERSSDNALIKSLITKEMSKEENQKQWVLGFPTQSKLQRTNSVHHLEPSDFRLGKIGTDWTNPIIVLRKNADTSASEMQVPSLKKARGKLKSDKVVETSTNQKQMDAKQLNREVLHHQVKEYVDVLEIFKKNKDLFLKILQETDVSISKNFPGQQTSNTKVKLTKSGSFPVADMSRVRFLSPSTLESKQNETWTFPKVDKLVSRSQLPKLDAVRSPKGYNVKADDSIGSSMTNISSQDSSQVSNHQRWNHLVIARLRDIKQRIKHAIKESKESNYTNTDALATDGKEMSKSLENISMDKDGVDNSKIRHKTDGSDHDLSNTRLHQMRRTSSLIESLDRYTQLFDSSFSREAKLPHSKSLRLRNEDKISSRERAPKFFRRISSLSDLESFCSLLNEVAQDSEMPVGTEVDRNIITESDSHIEIKSSSFSADTDKIEPLDAAEETELLKETEQGSDINTCIEYSGGLVVGTTEEAIASTIELDENIVHSARVASIPQRDQEIGSTTKPETCFRDNIIDPAECSILEGSENPRSIPSNEADSSLPVQNRYITDYLPGFYSKVNHKDNHFPHFELDINDASYNYVRDVLELSGFMSNESLGTWYSLDEPLNPSLFKELEIYLHQELEYSPEEVSDKCDHQLLFDLINETLLEIYERSFTYFPRAFSFNQHIRPMPKGHRVLNEVWARICGYLSFRSKRDQSLDDIVTQDLAKAKGDGWINEHQFETECVALELEDMIFDELLEEVICSLDS